MAKISKLYCTIVDEGNPRKETKLKLEQLCVRLFGVYLAAYLINSIGVFPISSIVDIELLGLIVVLFTTLSLGLRIRSESISPKLQKGILYAFVVSTLLLAAATLLESDASDSGAFAAARNFLHGNLAIFGSISFVTGFLTLLSVHSDDREVSSPRSKYFAVISDRTPLRGYLVSFCALSILAFFVWLRWPFLGDPFGGVIHSDKYATHVPILQGMYRTGDPFYLQNPTENVSEIIHLPIFSWSALPLLLFGRNLSLEFAVRAAVTAHGILLLIVLFLALRELFDDGTALVGLLLFAVNPMFNLVSYLTVMDLPALTLGFASIVLYWRDRKTYSYLLCGLAVLTKYSFLLIVVPSLLTLILYNETEKFYNTIQLSYFAVVPVLFVYVLGTPFSRESSFDSLLIVVGFVAILWLSVLFFDRNEARLVDVTSSIDKRIQFALLVGGPILGLVFLRDLLSAFAPYFLTDRYLLFNLDMYAELLRLTREHVSNVLFYLAPLGGLWILADGTRKERSTLLAIVFGAIVYAVVASKSVFIHAYYKHLLVFVIIVSSLGIIGFLRRTDIPPRVGLSVGAALLLLIVAPSQAASIALLDDDIAGNRAMGEYIESNVSESESVVWTRESARIMSIYADAHFVSSSIGGDRATLRSEIESEGFGTAMRDRNVTYYVSKGPGTFVDFESLSTDHYCSQTRRDYILSEVSESEPVDRCRTESAALKQFFELETRIGDWYLYRITQGDERSLESSEAASSPISAVSR